jgi:integrase
MAVEIMRSQRQKMPDDFVFEGRHSGKPMSGWSQMADTLRTESNIPDFGLHDLRRTFRSGLTKLRYAPDVDVEIDSDLAEIMLNHTRAELIEIYDREPRYEARMAAAKAWANYVAKVIGHGGVVRLEEMK